MSDHIHDEHCEHDHEEEIIEITDENGVVHEMVIAYTFEAKGKSYAILLDRNNAEAETMIFRFEEKEDELFLADIEDDEEWQLVLSVYDKLVEEEQ